MNLAQSAPWIVVGVLLLGARFAVNLPQADQQAEQEKFQKRQSEEKAQRLAGHCGCLLTEEDYAVMFPDQPRQDQYILIGSNDDDWHLHWQYDTSFGVTRSELEDGEGPPRVASDRVLLKDAASRMVKQRNEFQVGQPAAWVVQQERDRTHLEMFPVREFTYTYRKYTT